MAVVEWAHEQRELRDIFVGINMHPLFYGLEA